MEILIWDYTGIAEKWLAQFAVKKNLEIVGTINPATDKKLLAENSWEYLLVFEQGARQFFVVLAQFMNISPERVIYALDWDSWAEHPAATFVLLNPVGGGGGLPPLDLQHRKTIKLFYGNFDRWQYTLYWHIGG